MREKIDNFLRDEERASAIIINWLVGIAIVFGTIGISAFFFMR